jgi:hypothetical protein
VSYAAQLIQNLAETVLVVRYDYGHIQAMRYRQGFETER